MFVEQASGAFPVADLGGGLGLAGAGVGPFQASRAFVQSYLAVTARPRASGSSSRRRS